MCNRSHVDGRIDISIFWIRSLMSVEWNSVWHLVFMPRVNFLLFFIVCTPLLNDVTRHWKRSVIWCIQKHKHCCLDQFQAMPECFTFPSMTLSFFYCVCCCCCCLSFASIANIWFCTGWCASVLRSEWGMCVCVHLNVWKRLSVFACRILSNIFWQNLHKSIHMGGCEVGVENSSVPYGWPCFVRLQKPYISPGFVDGAVHRFDTLQ